jgi:hypothetical protein
MTSIPYTTKLEILENAHVSDDPETMGVETLAPEVQAHIVTARLQGYHLVSVRWPTGQFALMFCEPGCQWPDPQQVIAAYQRCLQTSKVFPIGNIHENS